MKAPSVRAVRCAIYTRVSTEYGLDQDFNSLDAQYDAASAYIKSQAHAGWTLIRSRYDDGGYSGGSTDRPDLQKRIVAAVRVGERRWNLRLNNGADVMLPEGHEVQALDRLVQLQQQHALLDRPLAAIDMRLGDRLVLRPRPDEKKST